MSSWPHCSVAVFVLPLLGCGDGESPPEMETCPDNLVTVSVQHPDSAPPTFTWTPPCAVSVVKVSTVGCPSVPRRTQHRNRFSPA
jgi:hypothetical protein